MYWVVHNHECREKIDHRREVTQLDLKQREGLPAGERELIEYTGMGIYCLMECTSNCNDLLMRAQTGLARKTFVRSTFKNISQLLYGRIHARLWATDVPISHKEWHAVISGKSTWWLWEKVVIRSVIAFRLLADTKAINMRYRKNNPLIAIVRYTIVDKSEGK